MAARFTTLADWLAWQESHHPSAIDLGLDRVREVAARMGILNPKARVITIAGTNGKGSCVATLESLLIAAGKRVGAYSSPHFLRYNERVRLQGQNSSDAALCESFARIDTARGDISLTYFEFGTLAAIDIFYRAELDYWVLEVGLGGRLDAVNIIDPSIAVITSIAIDHEAWLGSDRETIGREKAGICRPKIPCVCADENPPQSIKDIVTSLNCETYWWQKDFGYQLAEGDSDDQAPESAVAFTRNNRFTTKAWQLPAPSVASALQVLEIEGIIGDTLSAEQVLNCIEHVQLTGRMQKITRGNQVYILDVAHNPAACELLARNLLSQNLTADGAKKPIVAVTAAMADKDIAGMYSPLKNFVSHWWCCDLAGNNRAATADKLKQDLMVLGVARESINIAEGVASALDAASEMDAVVVVFGSFFTVAAAFEALA